MIKTDFAEYFPVYQLLPDTPASTEEKKGKKK